MVLFWGWELGVGVQAWVVECVEWSTFLFSPFFFFPETKTKVPPYGLARRSLEAGGRLRDTWSKIWDKPPPSSVCKAVHLLTFHSVQ